MEALALPEAALIGRAIFEEHAVRSNESNRHGLHD